MNYDLQNIIFDQNSDSTIQCNFSIITQNFVTLPSAIGLFPIKNIDFNSYAVIADGQGIRKVRHQSLS